MSSPSLTGQQHNGPTKYIGPNVNLCSVVTRNRIPTGADIKDPTTGKYYPFSTFWIIGQTSPGVGPVSGLRGDLWYLNYIAANVAYWTLISSATGDILSISDNDNTPVFPSSNAGTPPNNIQLEGQLNQQVAPHTDTTVADAPGFLIKINPMSSARWIVDRLSTTANPNGSSTTIAAAIAAATSGDTIFIMPGTYTENITLKAGVCLAAYECDSSRPNVKIVGKVTHNTAGTVCISGISFETNAAACIEVSGAVASVLVLKQCFINCTNATGISYTSSSASSVLSLRDCSGNVGTTGITLFSATSTGFLSIQFCYFSNSGATTTASTMSAGGLYIYTSGFNIPITTSGTNGLIGFQNSIVSTDFGPGTTCFTVGGSALNFIQNSIFQSLGATSLIVSSEVSLTSCTFTSTNASSVIGGAGTLKYSGVAFGSTGSLITTTSQVPMVFSNDAIQVVTPAAYPYTPQPQDGLIKVDTSVARSITPMAAPFLGQKHIIKDTVGTAAANNITITPVGKNIDGAASYTINLNYGSVTIIYNGVEWSIC